MDSKKLSHDILNALERLRIMHDLVRSRNYVEIPKAEMERDLAEELKRLEENFRKLMAQ